MENKNYMEGFFPYALAAGLVGFVGGFSAVLPPAFVQDAGIAYNNTTWISLAVAMSTAAFAPVLGKLGDIIGRKRTLLLGLLVFAFGNAVTALTPNLPVLLTARFVAGMGAAAIAPVVMAYIILEFPPQKMAEGFAVYMLISSGAVVFGPTLGSMMINAYGWRTMMAVCGGLSFAVTLVCAAFQERHVPPKRSLAGFDASGGILVLLFFSLVLCIPSVGQNIGWTSTPFLLVLGGSVLSLICLIATERRAENPIIPGSFIMRKAFLLPVLALFLTQGLMQANMTNTIVFVNYTQPENTLISGFAISVMYIGMALGAVLLGPRADKIEPKSLLTVSLLITGAGCGLMLFFTRTAPAWLLMASLGVLGLGLGGNGTIFMKVVLNGLSQDAAGAGTGTYGLFRDLSAPFGVAILVPLFTNRVDASIASGMEGAAAAVESIRMVAMVEILCAAVGIFVVRLLPRIYSRGNEK